MEEWSDRWEETMYGPEMEIEKLLKTDDDWNSNFEGDKVKVSLCYSKEDDLVSLAVEGDGYDCHMLSLDYDGKTGHDCLTKLKEWESIYDSLPEPLNKSYLKSIGFKEF